MKEKQKRKSGVARLFEIAGEKKGLLILAGILSAVSALCMLVPYWSVYEVLKELLLHGSKINEYGMQLHEMPSMLHTAKAVLPPDR